MRQRKAHRGRSFLSELNESRENKEPLEPLGGDKTTSSNSFSSFSAAKFTYCSNLWHRPSNSDVGRRPDFNLICRPRENVENVRG